MNCLLLSKVLVSHCILRKGPEKAICEKCADFVDLNNVSTVYCNIRYNEVRYWNGLRDLCYTLIKYIYFNTICFLSDNKMKYIIYEVVMSSIMYM